MPSRDTCSSVNIVHALPTGTLGKEREQDAEALLYLLTSLLVAAPAAYIAMDGVYAENAGAISCRTSSATAPCVALAHPVLWPSGP